jgi:electron transport complex protein RnfA
VAVGPEKAAPGMSLPQLVAISVGAILTENFILVRVLGICPFIGVSKKMDTAAGMGLAVTFVMGLSSAMTYLVNSFLLVPLGLGYMQTVVYILLIAALVQFVEMVLQKFMPALHSALGIYLPLITTNCAVLGVALLSTQNGYDFIGSVLFGVCAGLGFLLAIVLFASIRERLEFSDYPKCFEGYPIALITAGLLSMAFMGFSGLKIW